MTSTLIVGGLTVDRFSDGTVAPGGSVLHSGLATVAQGASLTSLTVAGDEPAARLGLDRLRSLGALVCQPAAATTTYRHEERNGVRVLVFEARAAPNVSPAPTAGTPVTTRRGTLARTRSSPGSSSR